MRPVYRLGVSARWLLLVVVPACAASSPPEHGAAQPSTPPPIAVVAAAADAPATEASTEAAPSLPAEPAPASPLPPGRVEGIAVTVRSYCGGAAPPPDLLKKLATPAPRPGVTLLVRQGPTNDVRRPVLQEVKTDAEGRFSLTLPPGEYCVVDDTRRAWERAPVPNRSETCYVQWLRNCEDGFRLDRDHGQRVTVTFRRGCDDPVCVPMPPRP